ncbi:MAG: ferredoxin [Desulfurivibrio sp.]|nr:ferredoxin [Desulfurivibrio sp.]MBU2538460.1 ferredoxin [Pseudomonadota bacterium]MBU3937199.1 ferredoxin [Pseudomonadota bacterium]MBU4119100.1 ferredoxin [Pseudomonadota bacterium]
MSKQVIIDTDECIGCQSCVEICPDVFGFNDDDNKAFVINPDGGSIECADEAAASCPAECIHIK